MWVPEILSDTFPCVRGVSMGLGDLITWSGAEIFPDFKGSQFTYSAYMTMPQVAALPTMRQSPT